MTCFVNLSQLSFYFLVVRNRCKHPMWNVLLRFFSNQRSRTSPQPLTKAEISRYRTMSSGSSAGDTVPASYAVTISAPATLGAVPDTVSAKGHWLMDSKGEAKGFVNPWESSYEYSFSELFRAMIQLGLSWPHFHKLLVDMDFADTNSLKTAISLIPLHQLSRLSNPASSHPEQAHTYKHCAQHG